METEPFEPAEFERLCLRVPWVSAVHALVQVGSTNDEAARLARDGALEGTVVVADSQTAGRGRLDRQWLTEPGTALSASWIVRFAGPAQDRPLLTLATAVAAANGIETLGGIEVRLKWPNDLMSRGRKLGGILAEATGDAVVMGLGVNVRQAALPEEIRATATSLLLEGSRPVGRAPLLAAILESFAPFVSAPRAAMDEFRMRCDTIGSNVAVTRSDMSIAGRATGIDDSGALVVQTDDGQIAVNAGDVVHVR